MLTYMRIPNQVGLGAPEYALRRHRTAPQKPRLQELDVPFYRQGDPPAAADAERRETAMGIAAFQHLARPALVTNHGGRAVVDPGGVAGHHCTLFREGRPQLGEGLCRRSMARKFVGVEDDRVALLCGISMGMLSSLKRPAFWAASARGGPMA